MDGQLKLTEAMRVLDRIERQLEAERQAIKAELAVYPAPITGCDAQYNHLSEERRRLAGELRRLAALRRQVQASPDAAAALEAVLSETPELAEAARRGLEAGAKSPA